MDLRKKHPCKSITGPTTKPCTCIQRNLQYACKCILRHPRKKSEFCGRFKNVRGYNVHCPEVRQELDFTTDYCSKPEHQRLRFARGSWRCCSCRENYQIRDECGHCSHRCCRFCTQGGEGRTGRLEAPPSRTQGSQGGKERPEARPSGTQGSRRRKERPEAGPSSSAGYQAPPDPTIISTLSSTRIEKSQKLAPGSSPNPKETSLNPHTYRTLPLVPNERLPNPPTDPKPPPSQPERRSPSGHLLPHSSSRAGEKFPGPRSKSPSPRRKERSPSPWPKSASPSGLFGPPVLAPAPSTSPSVELIDNPIARMGSPIDEDIYRLHGRE